MTLPQEGERRGHARALGDGSLVSGALCVFCLCLCPVRLAVCVCVCVRASGFSLSSLCVHVSMVRSCVARVSRVGRVTRSCTGVARCGV